MSQENVELVRAMYEAFNRGDFAIAREMLHPDAELHQDPAVPDTASYYGRDEWERGFAIWLSEWEEPLFQPMEIADVPPGVLMRVRLSGTGKASGVPVATEFFHAWTLRDGKPHTCVVRTSRADALNAVGLEE
jgi:ketosteroid isomerase-like protein